MFDFCIKEFLRLHSESIDPCDESVVATEEEEETLLESDDEMALLLLDDLSVFFPCACDFDIVSATL
jgi:hypothetical protein